GPGDVVLIPVGANESDLAEFALGNEFLGQDVVLPTALLRTGLHDPIRGTNGSNEPVALLDGVGDGFFAVDVFACVDGGDDHRHMPVVGSADDHGVDVFAIEDLVEIAVVPCVRRELFLCFEPVGLINIANGNNVVRSDLIEEAHQVLATRAGADSANLDAVIRSQNATVGGGRGKCASHEGPAVEIAHAENPGHILGHILHGCEKTAPKTAGIRMLSWLSMNADVTEPTASCRGIPAASLTRWPPIRRSSSRSPPVGQTTR